MCYKQIKILYFYVVACAFFNVSNTYIFLCYAIIIIVRNFRSYKKKCKMVNVVVLIILLCAKAILSEENPIPVKGIGGILVKFYCIKDNVDVSKGLLCNWFQNGKQINEVQLKYIFDEDDYHNACTLAVMNLNPKTDHGLWKCKMMRGDDVVSTRIWNMTFQAAKVKHEIIVYKAPNATITEGQHLKLECLVEGVSNPVITWNRNEHARGNLIVFDEISRNDSGIYTCSVKNGEGFSRDVSEFIRVEHMPTIVNVFTSPLPKNGTIPIGTSLTLNCSSDGNSKSRYTWMKYLGEFEWKIVSHSSQFIIPNVTYSHRGIYICKVNTPINDEYWTTLSEPISVAISDATSEDVAPHTITGIKGRMTSIYCGRSYGHYEYLCHWFHNGKKVEPDNIKYAFPQRITNEKCEINILNLDTMTDSGQWKCEIKYNDTIVFYTKRWNLKIPVQISNHHIVVYKGENKDIVEGQKLRLLCLVDNMSEIKLTWNNFKKARGNVIDFREVSKYDSGIYTCHALNVDGFTSLASEFIDVKYPPIIQKAKIFPGKYALAQTSAVFSCEALANPPPKYTWVKLVLPAGDWYVVSNNSEFAIQSTDYSSQGHYVCHVLNNINGERRTAMSKLLSLNVRGPPLVNFNKSTDSFISITLGSAINLTVNFCSDPQPLTSYWILNNDRVIETNNTFSRFTAFPLQKEIGTDDCYVARMILNRASRRDSGFIMFKVRNIYGTHNYKTKLNVSGLKSDVVKAISYATLALAVVVTGYFLFKVYHKKFSRRTPESPLVDLNSVSTTVEDYRESRI